MKKSEFFDPPSTAQPSGTHFPGGNRCKIEIIIEKKSMLIYFTVSIMFNSNGLQRLWDRGDDQQGASEEMSVSV